MRSVVPNAVDEIAQRLAEQAGVAWASLSDHPGYQKFIWREQARAILALSGREVAPDAPDERRPAVPTFLS